VVEPAVEGEPVYLAPLHACERGAAERLALLLTVPAEPIHVDMERALAWLEQSQQLELAAQQREAIRRAIELKVLVLTGGPGTGKTTIVKSILSVLSRQKKRVRLAAPTGRAAKRLSETTGVEASTIHRLLEFDPRRQCFERNLERPLAADLLVVDEMSMADMVLFHNLLKAVPPAARLLLVGDVDQLPSVGPGRVLQDAIASGVVPVVRLTEIFRQARESLIVVNAHRVNRGELPRAAPAPGAAGSGEREPDFYIIEREEPQAILETIKELVVRRVPAHFRLDRISDIQVLTPMHRGLLGSSQLNSDLQSLLNPGGEELQRGSRSFRVGDKVMQIRNNYDLEVFNGDLGRVVAVDQEERQLRVRFDERVVIYDPADLDELVLGYACSVHKAQGSEYPVVILPLHTQHYPMLQRNLLYTAITRARRLCILVGSRRALALAVNQQRTVERFSRFSERLREAVARAGRGEAPL
jgi:exodeoxyribonuclease V alpha subunit